MIDIGSWTNGLLVVVDVDLIEFRLIYFDIFISN